MAKRYRVTAGVRWVNKLATWATRLGLGRSVIMTTTGRHSGEPRRVPVSPLTTHGVEYVVAPYGATAWVHNVRADPRVTLRHGSRSNEVTLTEVTGPEMAEVVAEYYRKERFARPYMDVADSPTVDDFASRAARFPVFRVD